MKNSEIISAINRIKKQGNTDQSYISNCYINFARQPVDSEWDTLQNGRSLILIAHEYKVDRFFFFASNMNDMVNLSHKLDMGIGYTLDIVSRDRKLYADVFAQMGFYPLAEMQRVVNGDISSVLSMQTYQYLENDISFAATQDDLESIYNMLWNVFDTRVSHLPDRAKLCKLLFEDEFRIVKDEKGNIVTLHQAVIEPKSYYFNQIINKGNKRVFHSCILNSIKRYCEAGGKYAYAWVENTNIASKEYFKKYGLLPDGLYTSVYVKD